MAKKNFAAGADRFFSVTDTDTTDTSKASTTNTTSTTSENPAKERRAKAHGDYIRLSVGIAPDAMQYLRVMAAITGDSAAGYIEKLIRRDMDVNGAVYEKARGLSDSVK